MSARGLRLTPEVAYPPGRRTNRSLDLPTLPKSDRCLPWRRLGALGHILLFRIFEYIINTLKAN